MSFGKPQRALLGCGLLVVLSGVLVLHLYSRLIAEQRPQGAFTGLPLGLEAAHVYSQDKCVGWVKYEFEYDGSYSFVLDSELRYAFGSAQDTLDIRGGLTFNSLQQLSGVLVKITSETGSQINVSATGVNPIVLTVKATTGDNKPLPIDLERRLPGPIVLFEQDNGNYSLRTHAMPGFEQISTRFSEGQLFKVGELLNTVKQDFTEEELLRAECLKDSAGSISLDIFGALIKRVQGFSLGLT